MHWILPALMAPFMNSAVNFIDKYLVAVRVKNHRVMPLYSSAVNFLFGFLVWIAIGFSLPDSEIFIFATLSGFLLAIATVIYYDFLSQESTSSVVFAFELTPVLVLLAAVPLLGQTITAGQCFGFFLVLTAVLSISYSDGQKKRISAAFIKKALAMDFAMAGSIIAINIALKEISFLQVLCYQGLGMGLGGAVICLFSSAARRAFVDNKKNLHNGTTILIIANESLTVLYEWVFYFAYLVGPAALVSVVGGVRAFYTVVLGFFLAMLFPGVIDEDISKRELTKKIVAAIILLAGFYFIYS